MATGELLEAKSVPGPGAGLCDDYVTTESNGRALSPMLQSVTIELER